ncbi:hypothetical protein FMS18_16155 [Desulfovibrio sp. JC022]|nr:hypothetical protein [Desulfovibrio sp. JC022]
MIHFGYREYDPVIGRFISPDPLGYAGGDVDVYGYCLDDPINFVDRKELFSNGTIGAFGSGDSSTRAHSTLGFNGNRTIGKNNDQSNNSSAKSSVQQAREMEKRAAEIAQKEFQAEQAKLAETKERRDRTIADAQKRNDKMRQMVSIGAIELKNNPASPLTDTVDPNKQAKPNKQAPTQVGTGINTLSGKPEAQKARKEEPLAETMAKAQMAKEKATLERRARGDMERRNHRTGLLAKTANAKQQSKAKKGMLTTKEYDDITDSVFNVDPNDQVKKMNSSPLEWGGQGRSLKDGPKYGNWGGGNYSGSVDGGKVGSAEPVDSLDEAYKAHDLAYERAKNMDILGDVNKTQKELIQKADEELVNDLKN